MATTSLVKDVTFLSHVTGPQCIPTGRVPEVLNGTTSRRNVISNHQLAPNLVGTKDILYIQVVQVKKCYSWMNFALM